VARDKAPGRVLWLLLGATLPVFFVYLGANSIWEANEAFYVETPRQMLLRGDYITPWFNDELRLNKPVLSYWVVAALYKLFGVSITTERVGIACGAIGIIAAAWLIGRALRSESAAWLSALIVATSPWFVFFARRIFIDIYVTLFTSVALACLVSAERDPARRRPWLLAMYVAIGLAVLTKGPAFVALPALACLVWLALEGRLRDLRRMSLVAGALIVAVIVAPWYVALARQHGWAPLMSFLSEENVARFTTSMASEDRRAFFYIPVLLGMLFPWAPVVLVPIATAWRRRDTDEEATHASIRRLLWVWIVTFVAFFSFSATKQDLYILPVAPAVAALVADAIMSPGGRARTRVVNTILGLVAVILIALGAFVFWWLGSGYYAIDAAAIVTTLLVAGGVLTLVALLARRTPGAVVALAVTFIAIDYVFVARVLPGLERLKPVVPLADFIKTHTPPEAEVGSYHLSLPSLVYYVGRKVDDIGTVDHVRAYYFSANGSWVVMSEEDYESLRPVIPNLCVAYRRARFDAKLRDLLDQRPPPDVLLVTNRCR